VVAPDALLVQLGVVGDCVVDAFLGSSQLIGRHELPVFGLACRVHTVDSVLTRANFIHVMLRSFQLTPNVVESLKEFTHFGALLFHGSFYLLQFQVQESSLFDCGFAIFALS
jgi:hypothetical protein